MKKSKIKEELREHNIIHSTVELELKEENCDSETCVINIHNHDGHHH